MTQSDSCERNAGNNTDDKENSREQVDLYHSLPRTITPIGIFFGTPATRENCQTDASHASCAADVASQEHQRPGRMRRAPMGTPVTRLLFCLAATLVFALMWCFFNHPALSLSDPSFVSMLFMMFVVFAVLMMYMKGSPEMSEDMEAASQDGGVSERSAGEVSVATDSANADS
ncbi:hypothetical protein [Adlercreutzia sp. ZJ138]|uniref:hypothetical protein n=1 Tax=Adlercreutzia sp. ZJ138 TaxID=2709405 RepID=UPI0013EA8323|nr:hypothetical protein [Adlercreutzia sp. ZJ138]